MDEHMNKHRLLKIQTKPNVHTVLNPPACSHCSLECIDQTLTLHACIHCGHYAELAINDFTINAFLRKILFRI